MGLVHVQVMSDNIGASNAKAHSEEPRDFLEGGRDESSFVLRVSVIVSLIAAWGVQLGRKEARA